MLYATLVHILEVKTFGKHHQKCVRTSPDPAQTFIGTFHAVFTCPYSTKSNQYNNIMMSTLLGTDFVGNYT